MAVDTPPSYTGKLADPSFRRERARKAAAARLSIDHHIDKVVEAGPTLTTEQLDRLRQAVARSRAAQGLPPVVTDPAAIQRAVAALALADVDGDGDRSEPRRAA
jgi:hypothetical protein